MKVAIIEYFFSDNQRKIEEELTQEAIAEKSKIRFYNFSFLPTENTVSASFRLSPAGKCFLSFFRFCRQMPFALSPVLPAKCRKHRFNILFRSCLLELNGLGNSILVGITKFDSAHRAAGKPCPVKNDAPATLKRFLPPVHQTPRDPNDRPMSRCVVHYIMSICRNQAFLFR